MIKSLVTFLCIGLAVVSHAQDASSLWEAHFSFYNIKDIVKSTKKIYAASENAVFAYDVSSNEMETITTVDGLSSEKIAAIGYSENHNIVLVGYENGLIGLILAGESKVKMVVDIFDKKTIPPDSKKINHFNVQGDLVYIATNFGISIYNLKRLEFGDSYFIGPGGTNIPVKQTTALNGNLYAACLNNNGIKKASLSNPNLIDYQQWQNVVSGSYVGIVSVDEALYAAQTNRTLYELSGNNLIVKYTYPAVPVELKSEDNKLIVTTKTTVYVYDSNFEVIHEKHLNPDLQTNFTSAIVNQEIVYAGTSSVGVVQFISNNEKIIRPNGPLRNDAFKIKAGNKELWVSYGDYDLYYDPSPIRSYGISHYVDKRWHNISKDSVLSASNLNDIAINPFDPSQVFISSYHRGILEIRNEEPFKLMDQTNSGLETLFLPSSPSYISVRQSGLAFDRKGLLWSIASRVDKALKSYNPTTGEWRGYSFGNIINDPLNDELGFSDLVIDKNGIKWVGAYRKGVIGYDTNTNKIAHIHSEEQNMPATDVRALAVDNNNQLWIGTIKGLRVLYNSSSLFDKSGARVREIVVMDDGIPQELLFNQYITDIKVDGSNNKWIGTSGGGIFYFSPDGQETVYHFTTDNSPLPSNIINDISIDSGSGKIYIATPNGLVSFLSGGSSPNEALGEVYAYPNPVRPEYNILGADNLKDINKGVKIKGLTENVNIKITDIEGNLVAEAQSRINLRSTRSNYNFAIDGGTAIWNGKNFANHIVSSGVYLILISDLESYETKVLKLLIIR